MKHSKYFIAVVIPDPMQQELEAIKHDLFRVHGLKGALRSPSHITLHRPFSFPDENKLIGRLAEFRYPDTFDVELNDFSFFTPRVIFADIKPNEQLHSLHNCLAAHCRQRLQLFNESDDERGFHPHITLAFRDLKKPLFFSLREEFEKKKLSGIFHCDEFSLLRLDAKWNIIKNFGFQQSSRN